MHGPVCATSTWGLRYFFFFIFYSLFLIIVFKISPSGAHDKDSASAAYGLSDAIISTKVGKRSETGCRIALSRCLLGVK